MNRLLCWLFGHPAFGWSNANMVSPHLLGQLDGIYYCVRCGFHEPVWLDHYDMLHSGVLRHWGW